MINYSILQVITDDEIIEFISLLMHIFHQY